MQTEITISELAKLMQVSVHQIRYFEEKGILLPAYTDSNLYRRYGTDQIYRLAHILLLRKLGVPVQGIKEILNKAEPEQMQLQHALSDIGGEIARLQQMQQFIQTVLQEHQDFAGEQQVCHVKRREALLLQRWFEMDSQTKLSAKMLAEQAGRLNHLFETDLHYVYDNTGHVALYTAVESDEKADLILPEGDYLVYPVQAADETELEIYIDHFSRYAEREFGREAVPLVLTEKSYLSLFSPAKLHYELLFCLSADGAVEGPERL